MVLTMIAAVICGVVAIFVPEILGSGAVEINIIFDGGYSLIFVFVVCAQTTCNVFMYWFGLFGGVFSPAAMIGAAAGGFIGKFIGALGFATVPHLLPVAGFAAVTAAAVGAPISVVLVVFELTQSYEFVVAAMLAAVIAAFLPALFLDIHFLMNSCSEGELIYHEGGVTLELQSQSISYVVSDDFVAHGTDTKPKDAIDMMVKAKASEGYCIGADKKFIGKFALPELLPVSRQGSLVKHLMTDPVVLSHDASVLQAMEVASNFVGETIPVINHENGRLVGVVSEANIFDAYLATQSRVHDLEHG